MSEIETLKEILKKEPRLVEWYDEETGLLCRIVRTPSGFLCGYVRISTNHPYSKLDINTGIDSIECEVHGGVTFFDKWKQCFQMKANIGNDYCVGFDCAHMGDIIPTMDESLNYESYSTYKTFDYVKNECASLAQQLAKIGEV